MTDVAAQIRSSCRDIAPGEAAVTVACHVPEKEDATLLLDALGIPPGTVYRWDAARVAAVTAASSRIGREFSVNTVRAAIPGRAQRMVCRALADLTAAGLAEQTGATVLAASPGARGRKSPVYRLTPAGELLADDIAPMPGQRAVHVSELI